MAHQKFEHQIVVRNHRRVAAPPPPPLRVRNPSLATVLRRRNAPLSPGNPWFRIRNNNVPFTFDFAAAAAPPPPPVTAESIIAAIQALGKPNGSSHRAIMKHIANGEIVASKEMRSNLSKELKKLVVEGRIVMIKRSYKLAP